MLVELLRRGDNNKQKQHAACALATLAVNDDNKVKIAEAGVIALPSAALCVV